MKVGTAAGGQLVDLRQEEGVVGPIDLVAGELVVLRGGPVHHRDLVTRLETRGDGLTGLFEHIHAVAGHRTRGVEDEGDIHRGSFLGDELLAADADLHGVAFRDFRVFHPFRPERPTDRRRGPRS